MGKQKLNQLSIEFNEELCWNWLMIKICEVVNETIDYAWEVWKNYYPDQADMFSEEFKLFERGYYQESEYLVYGLIGNSHWRIFLHEFGTGSRMSKNNPHLNEYMNSGFYNPWRDNFGGAITTREDGVRYEVPDYKKGSGTVSRVGSSKVPINLEKTDNPLFKPMSPSMNFYNYVMPSALTYLGKRVENVLADFPFHEFLKVGGEY